MTAKAAAPAETAHESTWVRWQENIGAPKADRYTRIAWQRGGEQAQLAERRAGGRASTPRWPPVLAAWTGLMPPSRSIPVCPGDRA